MNPDSARIDDSGTSCFADNPAPKPATSHATYRFDAPSRDAHVAFAAVLDMTTDAVFFLTTDLRIIDVNAAAVGKLEYRRSDLVGMRLTEILAERAPERLPAALRRLLSRQTVKESVRARQRSKSGRSQPVRVQLQLIDDGVEPLLVAVARTESDRRRPSSMRQKLDHDYLTALPTRATLELRLDKAERRARRRRGRFAVLFIDIDGFKSINDTSGHRAGDVVLRAFGQRLLTLIRPGDFVARYGGDEFVAIIEDVRSSAQVERIATRVRAALGAPVDVDGTPLPVSASVGVAIGHATSSARSLLHEADQEMYRNKRAREIVAQGETEKRKTVGSARAVRLTKSAG